MPGPPQIWPRGRVTLSRAPTLPDPCRDSLLSRPVPPPRTIGDRMGEAKASGNLGNTLKVLGRFDEAAVCCQRHLDIAQEQGDKVGSQPRSRPQHPLSMWAWGCPSPSPCFWSPGNSLDGAPRSACIPRGHPNLGAARRSERRGRCTTWGTCTMPRASSCPGAPHRTPGTCPPTSERRCAGPRSSTSEWGRGGATNSTHTALGTAPPPRGPRKWQPGWPPCPPLHLPPHLPSGGRHVLPALAHSSGRREPLAKRMWP